MTKVYVSTEELLYGPDGERNFQQVRQRRKRHFGAGKNGGPPKNPGLVNVRPSTIDYQNSRPGATPQQARRMEPGGATARARPRGKRAAKTLLTGGQGLGAGPAATHRTLLGG